MRKIVLLVAFTGLFSSLKAQNSFSFSCARDTSIPCTVGCINLKAKLPDIKANAPGYTINPLSSSVSCFANYVSPAAPGSPTSLTIDDRYSNAIDIGFTFPFFGVNYTQVIASTNGFISFDVSKAGLFSHYGILSTGTGLSATGGTPQNLPSGLYDRAIIMGPYHDLNPATTTSPIRQIKYDVVGNAPHRKWILSFYKVPLFSVACQSSIQNTHQIVLYESTGIVEVFINDKEICPGWNQGRAMVGMQDYNRTTGVMAPGRAASDAPWGSVGMNESWRFVPGGSSSTGATLFRKVELYDLAGGLVATGDTASDGNGGFNVTFQNICPTASNTPYVIKSFYKKIDDTTITIIGTDTVNVLRNAGTVSATTTGADCATGNGTITITNPVGTNYEYSLNGVAWQPLNVFSRPPGNYTVYARIIGSLCVSTTSVTIASTSTMSATFTVASSGCSGASTGTITVNATGGTPPYLYSIDFGATYQTSNVFSGLAAGTYTIIVKDAGGCTFTIRPTISNGSGITATATTTNASCPGSPSGTITVNASSGTAPYTYSANGGAYQTSNVFTGMIPGLYTISVKDANGCTYSFNTTVGSNTGVSGNALSTNASCAGSATGVINVNVNTGVAPFTFSINGGAPQTSNIFNNLLPGTYTVLITDVGGCTFSFQQVVGANPGGITGSATSTNAACSGSASGSINVSANSGVAPFTFSLNSGAFQSSNIFNNLLPGNYTVTIKDAGGCTFSFQQTVGANAGVTGSATSTNASCAGSASGSITVTTNAGTAPFTYSLDGIVFQPSNIFSNLVPGNYTVTIKDAGGCTFSFQQTVGAGAGVTGNGTSTNAACAGSASGSITVTTNGGTAPFTFSLDGVVFQSSNVFSNLVPGNYTVTIKDAGGCTFSFSQTVGANAGVVGSATSTNAGCAGSATGSITVSTSAGVAPFTFSLNGGAFQSSNIFTGLIPGSYTITIKDAGGCTFSFQQALGANAGVTGSVTVTNTGCPGSSTGIINVNTSAGIAPFTYSLNGGAFQSSNTFNNLAAGTYSITIKDAGGCTFTFPATVNNNPLLTASLNIVEPSCFNSTNGTITITPSLGTAPYQYSLDASPYQANNVFSNVAAGNYVLHIKDATGCIKDTPVVINQPTVLAAISDTAAATCAGGDGTITITATGGTVPYQFSKDNGTTFQSSNILNVDPGTYTVLIKDSKGCTTSKTAVVTLRDNMFLDLGADKTTCAGTGIALTPNTNAGTNIFNWTPATGLSSATVKSPSANPLDTSKYFLTARWGVCQRSDSIIVNVLHKPVANAGADTIICDKTSAFLTGSSTNLSGAVKFLWSPANEVSNANSNTTNATPTTRGPHIYTLEVSDSYGCNFKVYDNVVVTMNPPVPAFAGNDTVAAMNLPHQLFASGGVQYLWSPGNLLDSATKSNPVAILQSDTRFTLMVTDNGGCIGYDTIYIKVYKGPAYYLPNAFTPNGDGMNDVFRAIPPGIVSTEYFRVFNRFGQMIFETNQYMKGWDGTYLGKPQPNGAYVWVIKGIDKFGKVVESRGVVMLLR